MIDSAQSPGLVRPGTIIFAVIVAMMAYVLYNNERFLIDPSHPVWQHYEPFKWWLLPHGIAGVCALFLVPLQFSERLRRRYTVLHRTIGGIYVTGVFVLGPIGVYIQFLDEGQGASRSFTIETVMQSGLLMVTTGIGLYFALKRMFTPHRQWMIRSYAVALTFLEIRVIFGVTGLDQPFNWATLETIVWFCVGTSLLVADIANQIYDLKISRPRLARAPELEQATVVASRSF